MIYDTPLGQRNFTVPESPGSLPYRSNVLAVVEGIVLLGGLALLDRTGMIAMADWPVHPYLFVVILLGAQYGVNGGILSALGAIALTHLDGLPVRPLDMPYVDYFRIAWAGSLSWVAAGLMVGIVASYQGRQLREQAHKLRQATVAEKLIASQYEILATRTHNLERTLAGLAATNSPVDDKRGTRQPTRHTATGRSAVGGT